MLGVNLPHSLTNQHVIDRDGRYELQTPDGDRYPVYYGNRLSGLDLAVVRFTSKKTYQLARFGNSDALQQGMTVHVAGWANTIPGIQGPSYQFFSGQLTSRLLNPVSGYGLSYDNKALPGMSGGPVLDENGLVVGINGQAAPESQTGTVLRLGIPINLFVATQKNSRSSIASSPSTLPTPRTVETNQRPISTNRSPSNPRETSTTPQRKKEGLDLIQQAVALARTEQYEAALAKAERATQLAPNIYQSWFLLGSLYLELDKLDLGIEALERARSLAPNEAEILFALGSGRFQKADYRGAIAELQAGLKIKPDVPTALFDLGNSYYKLKQYEAAIAQYEKVIDREEKFWPALNNIGLIEYEKGNTLAAIEQWKKAIAIDRQTPEPQLAMAVALYARGEREEGLKLAETAIGLDSRYANLEFLKENLWGDRLSRDAEKLLKNPRIQAIIPSKR